MCFVAECLAPLLYALTPCSIKASEAGVDALIDLGGGDMRRTLNLLQSTVMSSGEVTEDSGALFLPAALLDA